MNKSYIFTSKRLGFRNWYEDDIPKMTQISANPEVMKFFPNTATSEQTTDFIQRMQKMFEEKEYCYFAVDILESLEFIGFIGLAWQDYEASFAPCIDIGWRLDTKFWNRGFATEGAKRCVQYAFEHLNITNIVSTATQMNKKSIRVMEKIGMQKLLDFKHPKLLGSTKFENCVCYYISK